MRQHLVDGDIVFAVTRESHLRAGIAVRGNGESMSRLMHSICSIRKPTRSGSMKSRTKGLIHSRPGEGKGL